MQDKISQHAGRNREQRQRQIGFNIGYVIVGLLLLWLFQDFVLAPLVIHTTEIPYSTFKQKLAAGQIVSAQIGEPQIVGEMKNPDPQGSPPTIPFTTFLLPNEDPNLVADLQKAGIPYSFQQPPSPLGGFLLS